MSIQLQLDSDDIQTEHRFSGDLVRIGRRSDNDLIIVDGRISGHHGQILSYEGGYVFLDLESRNGSMISRNKLSIPIPPNKYVELSQGDLILLGDRNSPVKIKVISLNKKDFTPQIAEETIFARVAMEAPQHLDHSLAQLIYELGSEDDEMILVTRALNTCAHYLKEVSGLGYYEMGEQGEVSSVPKSWYSPYNHPPQPPSQSFSTEALFKKEVLSYLPMLHGESESVAGLAGAIIAPLHIHKHQFGVLFIQSERRPFNQDDLTWVSGLSAYLAARLLSAQRFSNLKMSSALLKEDNEHLKRRVQCTRPIIGESQSLKVCLRLLDKVAPTQATVLIFGETGTGKELAARYLHENSKRATDPFLAINCGALSENLLQSELFGHKAGAFTGANSDHKGAFAAARGGTIFLDEIGEISMKMQVNLLRVLQEKEFSPVGSNEIIKMDVRIIAATHKDLLEEVKQARFREDLYYRLAVFPVILPPLRERQDDIPLLISRFIELSSARHDTWISGCTDEAIKALKSCEWPGNIRQLEHEIERAVILAGEDHWIGLEHLTPQVAQRASGQSARSQDVQQRQGLNPNIIELDDLLYGMLPLKTTIRSLEEIIVRSRLDRFGQNRTRAAESLELSRQALQTKLAKWKEQETV